MSQRWVWPAQRLQRLLSLPTSQQLSPAIRIATHQCQALSTIPPSKGRLHSWIFEPSKEPFVGLIPSHAKAVSQDSTSMVPSHRYGGGRHRRNLDIKTSLLRKLSGKRMECMKRLSLRLQHTWSKIARCASGRVRRHHNPARQAAPRLSSSEEEVSPSRAVMCAQCIASQRLWYAVAEKPVIRSSDLIRSTAAPRSQLAL